MRVVFAGTPAPALPSLRAIADSDHELVAVVTRPDAPAGRGRGLRPSPVAQAAAEIGVPILRPDHPREPEFLQALTSLAPDCCAVVAYGALIPAPVLAVPTHGWVNLHFSVLPAWRGAAPVQHALLAGDDVTGATTFRLVPELDAGPVFGVMTEFVRPDDTAGDLLTRLADGGASLLLSTLDALDSGTVTAVPQPLEGVSVAPKLTVDDARLRWTDPAAHLERRVRACTPSPGAWTTLEGQRLKIGPFRVVDGRPELADLAPGVIVTTKREVFVGTGTAPVQLGQVQAVGKAPMAADAWARGLRLPAGTRLA